MVWSSTSGVDLSVDNPLGQDAHDSDGVLKLDQSTIMRSHLGSPSFFAPLNNDDHGNLLDS